MGTFKSYQRNARLQTIAALSESYEPEIQEESRSSRSGWPAMHRPTEDDVEELIEAARVAKQKLAKEPMKIEVGKQYKTRNGDPAKIYEIVYGALQKKPVLGAIFEREAGRWVVAAWSLGGAFTNLDSSSADIVSEALPSFEFESAWHDQENKEVSPINAPHEFLELVHQGKAKKTRITIEVLE